MPGASRLGPVGQIRQAGRLRAANIHKEFREIMSFYETVFIARQDISSAQAEALADTLAQIAQEHEGKGVGRRSWGRRNLADRIKKNRKGHYVMLNIEGTGATVPELERTMRINEDVLRYLTVRVETPVEAGQSVMMQARARGEERDRRRRGGYRRPH